MGELKDVIRNAVTDLQVVKKQRQTDKQTRKAADETFNALRFEKLIAALKAVFKMFPFLLGPGDVSRKNFAAVFRELFVRLNKTPVAAFKAPFNEVSISLVSSSNECTLDLLA